MNKQEFFEHLATLGANTDRPRSKKERLPIGWSIMGSNCRYNRGSTVGPAEQALEKWFLKLASDSHMTEKLLIVGNMFPDIKMQPDDHKQTAFYY